MNFLFFILILVSGVFFAYGDAQAASVNIDCSVGSPRTLTIGVDLSAGDDVTLTGNGTCVLDNPTQLTLNSLIIGDASTTPATILTHSSNTTTKTNFLDLDITTDVTIHQDASINVDGKGYSAQNGSGAGSSGGAASGGAYGGDGGRSYSVAGNVAGGTTYGSITAPNDFGSGGGSAYASTGGAGGGLLKLVVGGTFTLNSGASISADGQQGTGNRPGGGAGGGIYINAGTLAGSGTLTSDGGNATQDGNDHQGGSGAGGRIALLYTTDSSSYTTTAYAGTTVLNGQVGGAGSIYKKSTVQTGGDLTYDNNGNQGGYSNIDTITSLDSLTVGAEVSLEINSALDLPSSSLSLVDLQLDGAVTSSSLTTLVVTNDFDINAAAIFSALTTLTIQDLTQADTFTANSLATWTVNGTATLTTTFSATSLSTLNINGALTLASGYSFGTSASVTIGASGSLSHAANTTTKTHYIDLTLVNLTIASGGEINVDGKGYSLTNGTGAGSDSGAGGGGAYGGNGGAGDSIAGDGVGGTAYGSESAPNDFGSGGGSGFGAGNGEGGGYIRLNITGILDHDGTISSNGSDGTGRGGGGAGGGIYITTSSMTGTTGVIRAIGGQGGVDTTHIAGSGGGGRIAVDATSNSSTTTYSVAGGASSGGTAVAGDSGTLYLKPNTPTITSPTSGLYNVSVNPTLTTSTFAPSGVTHTTTDWFITSDSGCSTVVWSKDNDSTNLESIVVNDTNGTFSGVLAGEIALAQNTLYYACALHTSGAGDSGTSTVVSFTTEHTGTITSQTWDFNDDTNNYTFNATNLQVNDSLNSLVELIDLGGGTYVAPGLSGYNKRKAVTITNDGSALTNYQVRLDVSYVAPTGGAETGMQTDFGDVRFTSSDGATEIDYWIERYTASTTATIWVEVPTIAASPSSTTIYMYYGTSGTSVTSSNITNTFIFGDSFDNSLSGSWTQLNNGGSIADSFVTGANIDGYAWKKDCNGECDWWSSSDLDTAIYIQDPSPTVAWEAITYMVDSSQSGNQHNGIMLYESARDGYMHGDCSGSTYCWSQTGGGTSGSGSRDIPAYPHYFKITKSTSNGLGSSDTYYFYESDDGITWTQLGSSVSDVMDYVGLFVKDWTTGTTSATFDNFFIKSYSSNTVGSSFGSAVDVSIYDDVKILPSGTGTTPTYSVLTSISHSLGGGNAGSVTYQISNNGTNWYYHNGSTWTAVTTDLTDNNTITELNNYLPAFDDSYTGDFYFKAFLVSNGSQAVELDSITLEYDDGVPSGLADLAKDSNTATEAVFSWTAASDINFDHYEIWYGESQSDVQNRTGTATEWDDGDDTNLATVSTARTTINTGLTVGTTYYAKIWAIDALGAETTISDIQFTMTSGGGRKTAPRAIDTTTTGTQQESSDDQVASQEKTGLERLGVALNTPEKDTEIAVAGNELMQGAKFIRISELDALLDELQKSYTTVYFLFRYNNLISPIYSKVLGDAKPEIVQEDIIEELENIEDKEVEFDSENKVETNENEDITQVAIPDGKAIARIVGMEPGDIFKITDNDAVYYLAEDGTRHIFPNEFIYYSYYDDFKGVKEFSAEQVGAIPLGGNKKLSPGTWLVKIVSDPKVYAVEPGGILRHVSTENVAEKLYGANWNKKIIDINVSLFVDYTIGEPLADTSKHPDGVLVTYDEDKEGNNDVIYYVRDSELYQLSENDLQAFGARRKFIEVIDSNLGYVRAGILNDLL